MRKFMFSLILSILVLSITLTGYMAEEKLVWNEKWPTKIRIGAGQIGGGFYMGSSGFANALKEEFPELEVIVEQTKASIHNIKLIEAKEVDFAMCTANIVYEAWNGIGNFEGKEYKSIRMVMLTWPDAKSWATLKKSGITDVTQFTKMVSGFTKGSENDNFNHKVFETFGIKAEIVNISPSDSVESLKNGMIEGYIMGYPDPSTSELALTHDIRLIEITKEQAEYFLEKHPEYIYPVIIPGGYYKGVDEPVNTIGGYQLVMVRDDLPEDMVYAVLKAVFKHQEIVEQTWPIFGKSMKNIGDVKLLKFPFHKGAIRYYKEIGVELSEAATSLDE